MSHVLTIGTWLHGMALGLADSPAQLGIDVNNPVHVSGVALGILSKRRDFDRSKKCRGSCPRCASSRSAGEAARRV
jgi:hypothetical protein